jgi:hypothetical protein
MHATPTLWQFRRFPKLVSKFKEVLMRIRGSVFWTTAPLLTLVIATSVSAASIEWVRQFGAKGDDISFGVAADGHGGTYVSGYTAGNLGGQNAGGQDAFLGRYDGAGNLAWMRQLGTTSYEAASAVSADHHGGVYIAGSTLGTLSAPGIGDEDAYLAKYNEAGDLLWTRQFGSTKDDNALHVAADGMGSVFVSGLTRGNVGGPPLGDDDAFVAKFDEEGNQLWARQVATSSEDGSESVAPDGLGNVFVAGYTRGNLAGQQAHYEDAFVAKYDATGSLLWTRQFGVQQLIGDRTSAYAVTADGSGNVYFAGEGSEGLFGIDHAAIVAKLDGAGNLVWGKQLDLDDSAFGYGITYDGLGHLYVSGRTPRNMGGHDDDAFVTKFDLDGNALWTLPLGSTAEDYGWAVTADPLGNVFFSGFTDGNLAATNGGWSVCS